MIRLRVSGDRDRAVQLVRNLERSKRFLAPRLTGEATQAKEPGSQTNNFAANNLGPPAVEFEILANYNPLPVGETYTTEKPAKKEASLDTHKPRSSKPGGRRRGLMPKPSPSTYRKPAAGGAR